MSSTFGSPWGPYQEKGGNGVMAYIAYGGQLLAVSFQQAGGPPAVHACGTLLPTG